MAKSFKIVIWAVLCIMVAGCYHQRYDKTYRIQPNGHNGGLTITNRFLDTMMMSSFSNDSIEDGGYITFRTLSRDGLPMSVYFVAPDSIFIYNSNVKEVESRGFKIFSVNSVYEYSWLDRDSLGAYNPSYYTFANQTDTIKVKRISFKENFTYHIEIYNDDIFVWDSVGNMLDKQKLSR